MQQLLKWQSDVPTSATNRRVRWNKWQISPEHFMQISYKIQLQGKCYATCTEKEIIKIS